jgi:hypothetical protein
MPALKQVLLVAPINGGQAPEVANHIQTAAPQSVQTLGRWVSLSDYEACALQLGVAKCLASWTLLKQNCMGIQVLYLPVSYDSNGDPTPLASDLQSSMETSDLDEGPDRSLIQPVPGKLQWLNLSFTCVCPPLPNMTNLQTAIAAALGAASQSSPLDPTAVGLFGLANRTFGQPETFNEILGVIQNVLGITAVTDLQVEFLNQALTVDQTLTNRHGYQAALKNGVILCPAKSVLAVDPSCINISTVSS